jgi:hypothetical protein
MKQAWQAEWEAAKIEMIKEGSWSDGSGKLLNPGKTFFLKLAAASVRRVSEMRDKKRPHVCR